MIRNMIQAIRYITNSYLLPVHPSSDVPARNLRPVNLARHAIAVALLHRKYRVPRLRSYPHALPVLVTQTTSFICLITRIAGAGSAGVQAVRLEATDCKIRTELVFVD